MLLKVAAVVTAGLASIILCSVPVPAAQTLPLHRIVIADLGRDTDAVARLRNSDAAILWASPAEVPHIQDMRFADSTANVAIRLDASGTLMKSTIVGTSGSSWLDASALDSARHSRYQAARVDGQAVGGEYIISVDFHGER